jgi:predicted DNA-binding transcriptional regulator AlpA
MSHPYQKVVRLSQLATTRKHNGILPVGPATIWRWVRSRPEFPKPFKIGEATTVWDLEAIEQFIAIQRYTSSKRSAR